jgi:hypothetical protein
MEDNIAGSAGSPRLDTNSPFGKFVKRHEAANRWFRSTNIAYMAAKMLAGERDPMALAQTLLPKKLRWKHTFQHYPGRHSDLGRTSRATVADFLQDLKEGWNAVLRATIIREVGALEIFLRDWATDALYAAITAEGASLRCATKQALRTALEDLTSDPFRTVSLTKIGGFFPAVKGVLTESTHLRSLRPMLAPGTPDLNCQSAAELWREVRNLLLHHDGIVHSRFVEKHGGLWMALQKDARERGSAIALRKSEVGNSLPVVTRHVIFCFTSCYQTAVILYLATKQSEA